MNLGDVITTAEQLDALPRGTIAVGDEAGTWPTPWLMIGNPRGRSGLRVWDDLNSDGNQPLRTSAQVLERNRSVTVVFVLGHLPRPERVVKAEALREAAAHIKNLYATPLPPAIVHSILHGLAAYAEAREA